MLWMKNTHCQLSQNYIQKIKNKKQSFFTCLSYSFLLDWNFKTAKIGNTKKCCFWKIPFPKKVTHTENVKVYLILNFVALPTKYYIIYYSTFLKTKYILSKNSYLTYSQKKTSVKLTCLLLPLKFYISIVSFIILVHNWMTIASFSKWQYYILQILIKKKLCYYDDNNNNKFFSPIQNLGHALRIEGSNRVGGLHQWRRRL